MQFTKAIAIATAAFTVSATPMQERKVDGVLVCTGPNSTGSCRFQVANPDECVQLDETFFENVSTFAPDGDDLTCYPYTTNCSGDICTSPEGCTLGPVDSSYPHKENLGDVKWDHLMRSYRCSLNTTSS